MAVKPAYLAAVAAASTKYNVPAELLAAQIQAESGWNPNAKSSAGATGISQFMPGTAKGFGIDPTNPMQSIDAQGKMMGRLIKSYGGNQDKALAAYNAGAGNVAKYGGVPPFKETHDYINRIHSYESNYPGLKSNHVAGLSPDAVNRANTYANMAGITSTGSQTAPKGSLQTFDTTASTGGYDASQALIGYLIKQSSPAHGTSDPTGDLMGLLSANQAALTVDTARGSKSIPVQRDTASPVTPGEAKVVSEAKKYLGIKYRWGGSSPSTGFDCSGFVQYVQKQNGVSIPRTTYGQLSSKAGKTISKGNLQPGDAVYFHKGSHMGMYIGNGKFIQAPHTGDVVKISDLNTYPGYYTARRFGKWVINA